MMAKEGIGSIVVPIEGSTRTNLTVVEESTGQQFRFGMISPPIKESEWQFCLHLLRQMDFDYIICTTCYLFNFFNSLFAFYRFWTKAMGSQSCPIYFSRGICSLLFIARYCTDFYK